uniref:Uncharacterized protein n=1 Tax=Calidris pygmaea TaxID=425635 RepID=A0A8C3K2T8_9CHAR
PEGKRNNHETTQKSTDSEQFKTSWPGWSMLACSAPAQLPMGKFNSHPLPLNSFLSQFYHVKL